MTAQIQRFDSNDYLSEITIFNQVVYLAGQVPNTDTADIHTQTKEVLDNICLLYKSTIPRDDRQNRV